MYLMKRIFVCLSFLFLIAGCSFSPYQPPTTGPTSVLKYPSISGDWEFFGGFSGGLVSLAILDESGCGEVSEELPAEEGKRYAETKIPANKDIAVIVSRHMGNTTCGLRAAFEAQPNRLYEVEFVMGMKACAFVVNDVQSEMGQTPVQLVEVESPGLSLGTVCKK